MIQSCAEYVGTQIKNLIILAFFKHYRYPQTMSNIVEASPGKDCNFVETCRSLCDTLDTESDSEEYPQNLVVSLPLAIASHPHGV